MTVYLLQWLNQCWMFVGSRFRCIEMSSWSSYFTWKIFFILSLMKNLLWKVRHIAALMSKLFFFGNCQLSSIVKLLKTQVQSQNYWIIFAFRLFCSGIEQDRIISILFKQKRILILEYSIFKFNLLRPINECTIFQRTKVKLGKISFQCQVISRETIMSL